MPVLIPEESLASRIRSIEGWFPRGAVEVIGIDFQIDAHESAWPRVRA
jgi:hypothetical protein